MSELDVGQGHHLVIHLLNLAVCPDKEIRLDSKQANKGVAVVKAKLT